MGLLRERIGLDVNAELPPIPYREIPAKAVEAVSGIHRLEDNDGLAVEFGACVVDVLLNRQDSGQDPLRIEFEDAFDDSEELPTRFRPAIDEGVRKGLLRGPTAGYPVLGARIRLTGGEYDILQSTEDHFRLAGEQAARKAMLSSGTRLMEPWWRVDVYVPSASVGEAIAEVSTRRGRVVGMDMLGDEMRVIVSMPYRELRTFSSGLQAVTAGRGRFFGDFSHYERTPDHLLGEAIASSPFASG
jgi:elongation factor G